MDPGKKAIRTLKEVVPKVIEERNDLIREFSDAIYIRDLLLEAKRRIEDIKDPKQKESYWKSVRKKVIKMGRRLGIIERKAYTLGEKVKEVIDSLVPLLPSHKPHLEALLEAIEIYGRLLLNYFSKRTGKVRQKLKEPFFDPDKVKDVFQEAIEKAIEPLSAALENFLNYLKKHEEDMEEEILEKINFRFDLGTTLRLGGIKPEEVVIVVDADFMKELEIQKINEKKTSYDLKLKGKIIIPKRVFKEMQHSSKWKGGTLISKELRSYLTTILKAEVKKVNPKQEEKIRIINIWGKTAKGSRSSKGEIKRFIESGDMSILAYCLRNQNIPIIVLSNDNDIIDVIKIYKYSLKVLSRVQVYSLRPKKKLSLAA